MPLKKPEKDFKPLWKEWDHRAQKEGQRHTVYFVNGDQYTGEWKDNKKCGNIIIDISVFYLVDF